MSYESEFGDLVEIVMELRQEVAALRRDLAAAIKIGVVEEVDAAKGYRLNFGNDKDGDLKKSAWHAHPEQAAGSRSWVPLKKGQTVARLAVPGDPRQGFLVRTGYTEEYPQPSKDLEEDVFTRGDSRVTVRKDEIREETITHNMITQKSINETAKTEINETSDTSINEKAKVDITNRAEKKDSIYGGEEVRIQGKKKSYIIHTDKDGQVLARKSILIKAPSVIISLSDPGPMPDSVAEKDAPVSDIDGAVEGLGLDGAAGEKLAGLTIGNVNGLAGIAAQVASGNFAGLAGVVSGMVPGAAGLAGVTSLGDFMSGLQGLAGGNISGLMGAVSQIAGGNIGGLLSTVTSIGGMDIGSFASNLTSGMSGLLSGGGVGGLLSTVTSLATGAGLPVGFGTALTAVTQIAGGGSPFSVIPTMLGGQLSSVTNALSDISGMASGSFPTFATLGEAQQAMVDITSKIKGLF